MSRRIGALLKKSGKTLSIAESCTGGLLGHRITAVSGSSGYFEGGIITYSDEIKNRVLGVSRKFLEDHGAVSKPVAEAMAEKVRRLFKTDYGISITGIAGPKKDGTKKRVGLVYIAVANSKKTFCKKFQFRGSRRKIKSRSAQAAIDLLQKFI